MVLGSKPLNFAENEPLVAPCAPRAILLLNAAVVPHSKPTSVGAVVAPIKEPDRVASVELGSISAAVVTVAAGSSPPALSPDDDHFKNVTSAAWIPTWFFDELKVIFTAFVPAGNSVCSIEKFDDVLPVEE